MKQRIPVLAVLVSVYAAAVAAGYIAQVARLPLPWMIGPLVSTALIGFIGNRAIPIPLRSRPFGQVTVAAQVGLSFSPAAFGMLLERAPLIVGLAISTCVCAAFSAFVLSRMGRIPLASAMLATLPTSPVEAAIMAERHGIAPGSIIFAQTLRIAGVVLIVPIAVYAVDGVPARSGVLPVDHSGLHTVLLFGIALLGAVGFRLLRISNPFFLGPLFTVACVTAVGIEIPAFPPPVLGAAQVVLGTWLGSNFQRDLFASAGRRTIAILCSGSLLILLCTGTALLLALTLGLPWEDLVLGAAPGGVTEMALTARYLEQNVALITAFHLVRIFLIVPNIPWVVARIHRFEHVRQE
ncbi:MAG: AbrB family transcriptional regulator [Paracoccaceae bacterium]